MELQNLNENYWREQFRKYDTDGNGKISFDEFKTLTESSEHGRGICPEHIKWTFRKADRDRDGQLDLDEFIRMVHHPKNDYTFKRLLRGYEKYIRLVVPKRNVANDGCYEDEYICWPPPVILVLVSLLQIVFYVADDFSRSENEFLGPIGKCLVYDPRKRAQIWRYVTYMFTHASWPHLLVNLLVQILLGAPLEMVHRGRRVLAVYLAGVVAGSLCISVLDPNVKLSGASSGVYSLLTAHIATIVLNWAEMTFTYVQLLIFSAIFFNDIGTLIYYRHSDELITYAAHYSGALAGLLVGITMLRDFNVKQCERIFRRITGGIYLLLIGTAVLWNIFYRNYYTETNKN